MKNRSYNRINTEAMVKKYPGIDIIDAKKKFWGHKDYAKNRTDLNGNKIEFKLTFDEWMEVWYNSNKWHLRGTGKGKYCMSRYNDIGHYEANNVFIQSFVDNVAEGNANNESWKALVNYTKTKGPWNKKI